MFVAAAVDDESMSQSTPETSTPSKVWTVHIEVRVSPKATARFDTIRNHVHCYLTTSFSRITIPSTLEGWEDLPVLGNSVERIIACESPCPSQSLLIEETSLQIHLYQPSETATFEEFTSGSNGSDEEAASMCELPNRGLEGLWDSLIYADNIKLKLLDYIHATLVLSDANVDFNLVSWNRVVLLHGPPGTGKTSLCRALAQKLSIRLSDRYPQTRLLEINSHSLFSKWFSESGKLVQKLFSSITDLVEDEDTFVVVLIDEVESLTAARAAVMSGTEPSDGLRVVNALLTQLDKLKHCKNVLVMSTSNLPRAIDSAFVDRADIIQYVDLPPRAAIYEILRTCLSEMIDKGVVKPVTVPKVKEAEMIEAGGPAMSAHDPSATEKTRSVAMRLLTLAALCKEQRMSGRALRRLPVLALARYIGTGFTTSSSASLGMDGTKATAKANDFHRNESGGERTDASRNDGTRGTKALGGGADVEVWLEGMEKVILDSGAEVGRFS